MTPKPHLSHELRNKARTLLQQQKLPEAIAAASDACKQDPSSVDAWLTLASIYAQQQDFHGVAECCRNAIKHQPNNATAHFNLGLALQSSGSLHEAIDAYQKAIQLQDNYTAAQINLAAALVNVGETEEALSIADSVLKKSPNTPEAINIRGRGLLKSGEIQAALEWFDHNLKSQGNSPQLIHGAALCHLAFDDTETAHRLLTQATQVEPGYAPAWAELGNIALQKETYKEAASYYGHAARIQPTHEIRFNLAHCLYASDRIGPARKLYKELLTQHPNDPLIHNNLGKLYERIGEFDSALIHFRRSVELQPDNITQHYNIGKVLLALGNPQEAIIEFDTAIVIDGNNYEAHFGRGQTLIELGNLEAAIAAFQSTLDIKPGHELAKYCITSLGGEATSEQDRRDFVAGLFNRYAEKFDHELVNDLKYDGPEVFLQLLQPLLTNNHDILDLGCGTGLCGPLFRPYAKRLIGVDISTKMIEKAKGRAVYDEFSTEDVASYMQGSYQEFDLIIAADVFIYIGDIKAVFCAAQQAIKNNGLFAFSIETCDGTGFRFRSSGRHAHSKDYIFQLAQEYHFNIIREQDWRLRMEYGKPIGGTAYVLRA